MMRSKRLIHRFTNTALAAVAVLVLAMSPLSSEARVLDEVVAFIDENAITANELEISYLTLSSLNPDVTRTEVLDMMVNRLILLREAKRLRLEAVNDDLLIEQYIDLKVRAFIKVDQDEMLMEYEAVKDELGGRQFSEVSGVLEKYMTEREVNILLKDLLEGLRQDAEIKILLKD